MEEVKKQGMESLFCPYELALELKELGFNEECFGWYSPVLNGLLIYCNSTNDGTEEKYCTAPLWQQAARFLYINSNKQINITINGEDNYKRLCEKFKKAIEDFRNL